MKVMIATGGTGGHIDPALALAEMLKQQIPDMHISFVGTDTRMEASLIPSLGYEYTGMHMKGMNGSVSDKILSAFSMLEAKIKCTKLLKQKKPDICIGFGNYISVPLILAASSMHIPTMIHEQNSFAGKANKLLGRYADAIATSYHSTDSVFPENKTRCLGNPMATLTAGYKKDAELIKSYGMNPDKPLVIIMAGSLGSETVSRTMDQAFSLCSEDYQVLMAAGKDNPYRFQYAFNDRIHTVPYMNGARMLASADLAVTRAGATTLAETAACGCPSILIPSPFVPDNHQVYNAMELVKIGAAVMIEEKDLTPEKIAACMNQLMADSQKRKEMKQNALSKADTDAAYSMIEWIKELTSHGSVVE